MKKYLFLLLPIAIITTLTCSCSDDSSSDNTYNPYLHQEKVPFYPQEIIIEKQSEKRHISEKWSFEYNDDDKTINSYTHETTTSLQKSDGEEITIEKESGHLSYFNNGNILNRIEVVKEISGFDYYKRHREEIIENVQSEKGLITNIERLIDSYNEDGIKTGSTTTTRTFGYAGEYCTSSKYTDADNTEGVITHTYSYTWNTEHKLTSVEIEEKGSDTRIHKTYNYTYGKLNDNHIFQTNAFLYNHLPQIYAAMGYFGKDCPYTMYQEEQVFKLFIDGKWEKDNSADSKTVTLINNDADIFKYDILSDIYNTNYYIKFTK